MSWVKTLDGKNRKMTDRLRATFDKAYERAFGDGQSRETRCSLRNERAFLDKDTGGTYIQWQILDVWHQVEVEVENIRMRREWVVCYRWKIIEIRDGYQLSHDGTTDCYTLEYLRTDAMRYAYQSMTLYPVDTWTDLLGFEDL